MSHLYARFSVSDQHPWVIASPSRTNNVMPINKWLYSKLFHPNFVPVSGLNHLGHRSLALLSIITLLILFGFFSLLGCHLGNDLTPVTKPDFC